MQQKIKLGEYLLQKKIISKQDLETALSLQQQVGDKLGKILVDNGFLSDEQLMLALSEQLNLPFIDLKHVEFDLDLVRQLPEAQARRLPAILLKEEGDRLLIGMADPLDIYAYDELIHIFKRPIKLAIVQESELFNAIDLIYRRAEEITSFAEELSDELSANLIDLQKISENISAQDAPVVKLLKSLFEDAIQVGASDIHIQPEGTILRIRQRVDGVLNEHIVDEKRIAPALTQRLKLMAGLNIAEKRLPQDGRFNIQLKGRSIDVRISTMPAHFGESVVLRLLDQSATALDLEQLGMPADLVQRLRTLVKRSHGMILVTGPTGSGKTTTLYSLLNELNHIEKKIITVEDPVEYRLPRVTQVQVNSKIDLSFSRVLRSTLRHDPDIIMIGEIRDQESARIGLQAAMTGHLVLATLHTNDALNSSTRLIDMGIKKYLIKTALTAVLAQRLVRKICDSCIEPYTVSQEESAWLETVIGNQYQDIIFKTGRGCSHCSHTGYHGRIGVYELLETHNPEQRHEVLNPLGLRALELAAKGITSLSEVLIIAEELVEER